MDKAQEAEEYRKALQAAEEHHEKRRRWFKGVALFLLIVLQIIDLVPWVMKLVVHK